MNYWWIRKFVNSLAWLGAPWCSSWVSCNANDLWQYIPVATPDTVSYSWSDYYEIELREYSEKMHSDLPATKMRWYVQVNKWTNTSWCFWACTLSDNTINPGPIHYLGPTIVARQDRPVRIKFINKLPIWDWWNLFIPVDTTVMGAWMWPLGTNTSTWKPVNYTQNRATLHMHWWLTPWISDWTPHQWITPAWENTDYPKWVSVFNVPDMAVPEDWSQTFFYSNQQTARLMFYHDHSYWVTRLNVYAWEAAWYVLTDPAEDTLITARKIPWLWDWVYEHWIPLIIQDKTFLPTQSALMSTDPTWDNAIWGNTVWSLWFPHVYMPNQNPNDPSWVNPFWRWDYGPWFWPPLTKDAWLKNWEVITSTWFRLPGTPNVSMVMEAFMDTPLVNWTVYPYLSVKRKAYRFRVLNASNDRFYNLWLYYASPLSVAVTNWWSSYSSNPVVTFSAPPTWWIRATWYATVSAWVITNIWLTNVWSWYTIAPTIIITDSKWSWATAVAWIWKDDIKMIPAQVWNWPAWWASPDNREGWFPDPDFAWPKMIQIWTEWWFLPNPVEILNTPTWYDMDKRSITVWNIKEHALLLWPAERADIIVDFSQVPDWAKLILYNDSPAPVPAWDARLDYYTWNPNYTDIWWAPTTLPWYWPNTRTIMQFRVSDPTQDPPFNLTALNDALPAAFWSSLDPIIIPQKAYSKAYGSTYQDYFVKIQDNSFTFKPAWSPFTKTVSLDSKAIQELFELDYWRMNSTLWIELPFTNIANQTTIPFWYIDPPTEKVKDSIVPISPVEWDWTQLWKITHNWVDTHAIHFHLFNVQLVNRVDWAWVVKPPEPNELWWKETVRMNPLEDAIVALRPVAPKMPFWVPDSIRPLDPTMPIWSTAWFLWIWPDWNPATVVNTNFNFWWEYVWHCHLLWHEEMDMMRPIVFNVTYNLPDVPVLTATRSWSSVNLSWTDGTPLNDPNTLWNSKNEIWFRIERAYGTWAWLNFSKLDLALANQTTFTDSTAWWAAYIYKVIAYNGAWETSSALIEVWWTVASATLSLKAWWNLVTLPLQPLTNSWQPISYNADIMLQISSWDKLLGWLNPSQQWVPHLIAHPTFNNFQISPGQWFVIHVPAPVDLAFTWSNVSWTNQIMLTGWNSIWYTNPISTTANVYWNTFVWADKLLKFDNVAQQWVVHQLASPGTNDFTINQGDSVFVHIQ